MTAISRHETKSRLYECVASRRLAAATLVTRSSYTCGLGARLVALELAQYTGGLVKER